MHVLMGGQDVGPKVYVHVVVWPWHGRHLGGHHVRVSMSVTVTVLVTSVPVGFGGCGGRGVQPVLLWHGNGGVEVGGRNGWHFPSGPSCEPGGQTSVLGGVGTSGVQFPFSSGLVPVGQVGPVGDGDVVGVTMQVPLCQWCPGLQLSGLHQPR